jgi:hypothetical protein
MDRADALDERDVVQIDVDEYWLRDLLAADLEALDSLLGSHAAFDEYVRDHAPADEPE